MRTYSSIEEYVLAVESKLPEIAKEVMGPIVESVLAKFTQSNVYGHYTPRHGAWIDGTTYRATRALLGGIESWTDGNTLYATSIATPNDSIAGGTVFGGRNGEFYELLESSNLGIWRRGFPRPVIGPAQTYIDGQTGKLGEILAEGVEKML